MEIIMKNIVITGATSMIGVALIEAALKDKNIKKIYAIVRKNTSKINRIPNDSHINIIYSNNSEYSKLGSVIKEKCDVFYHLAWPRTATYEEDYNDISLKCNNIQIVLDTLKVASELGCKKYVGAGSQAEYGISYERKILPEDICNPVRADGIIHLASERLAEILAKKLGIDFIWMRIFSIYGKYDRDNSMISSTITKLLKGEHCAFTWSEQKWDFLEAEDAGEAFYLVGKYSKGSTVYCLGSGEARPLKQYIQIIGDIVAPDAKLGFGEIPYPENPIMYLSADISSLKKDVGWEPKIDFEHGIRNIYKYICEKNGEQYYERT